MSVMRDGIGRKVKIGAEDFEFMRLPRKYWSIGWGDIRDGEKKNRVAAYLTNRFKPENLSRGDDWLVLIGPTCTGKSVVSAFVAKSFMARSYQVQWLWSHDLQTLVMEGHEFDEGLSWQEWALTCDVLVIDAVGDEMFSGFTGSGVSLIVSGRIEKDLPTIVSTSLSAKELDEKYGRGFSTKLTHNATVITTVCDDPSMTSSCGIRKVDDI